MRNRILVLLIVLIPSLSHSFVNIADSIDSVAMKETLELIDKDTIVLVTVDGTLTTPKSVMFNPNSPYQNFVQELLSRAEKMPVFRRAVTNWYQQRQIMLVEPGWPAIIEVMKKKGAKVYGLYLSPTTISNIEPKILTELRSLQVNFTDKINQTEVLRISDQDDNSAVFYHGVLFSTVDKARVFVNLIKFSNITPRKVVVFDHTSYAMRQFANLTKRFDFELYNIQYLGTERLTAVPNPAIVKLQQRYLIEQGVWLEDDRAAKLLSDQATSTK